MLEVKIKRLSDTAIMPTYAHATDAGMDLYANIPANKIIAPHTTELIGTGVAYAIPEGYFGGIYARSGLATRESLRPANCVGVVDSGYRDEVKVAIHNDSEADRCISPNERIAQMIIQRCPCISLIEVNQLDTTDRGSGSFGSTGK